MILIFFFLFLFHVGNCLIYFDKTYIDITTYGNTKVVAYLLAVDIFYKNNGIYKGCDIKMDESSMPCEILIYTRLCMVDQAKASSYNVDYFKEKHTFLVDDKKKVTRYTMKDLNCGKISRIRIGYQRNSWYGTMDTKKHINEITQPYSEILTFTSYTGDEFWVFYDKPILYGIYDINTMGVKTIIQENLIFKWEKPIPAFNSIMFQKYLIIVKCESNYFGKTCWFYCTDNIRRWCNCEFKTSYSNVPCNPTCKDGWLSTFTIYTVRGVKEGLRQCITRDLCYNNKECKYECLPINNQTYACENLLSFFRSGFHKTNITSDIFFYSESVTISLDLNVLVNKEVGVDAAISYNTNQVIFTDGIVSEYGDKQKTLQIVKYDRTDQFFYFTFWIYLPAWIKYFARTKYFRIYVKPDELYIYRNEDSTELENIIYIGEELHCNSTGRPNYRTIYVWSSLIIKFDFPFANNIKIPDNTELRLAHISINATLIIYDRPNEKMSTTYNVFIKPFVYFKWNIQNNVLEPTWYLQCIQKAYINVNILIIQMMGPSHISTINNLIHLEGYEGGEYELLCFFIADSGLQYMKKIHFQLKSKPTFICLFLFTNTIGSLVQCGHNGNFYDDYNIDISFNIFDRQWHPAARGNGFLQIPYYLNKWNYLIQCVVSSKFSNYTKTYKVMGDLIGVAQSIYPLTKEFKRCPSYADYVEEPIIDEYFKDSVYIKHFMVYLSLSDFQKIYVLIIFSIFILFIHFTILGLVYTYFGISKKDKAILLIAKHEMKMLKSRRLFFRLEEITNKKMGVTPLEFKQFYAGGMSMKESIFS